VSAPAVEALTALLAGYSDPEQPTRLLDVPPAVAARPCAGCRRTWPPPGSTSSSRR